MTSQSHEQPNITLNEISEVCKVIQSLQLGQAPGPDKIQPEHLRYGGSALVYHLTTLLNLIVELEYIPQIFQQGLIVPIPKSHDKDPFNPSNYRGITLLSTIAKVFEKTILLRLQAADIPDLLHPLQGGFKPGISCLHTSCIHFPRGCSAPKRTKEEGLCCPFRCAEGL